MPGSADLPKLQQTSLDFSLCTAGSLQTTGSSSSCSAAVHPKNRTASRGQVPPQLGPAQNSNLITTSRFLSASYIICVRYRYSSHCCCISTLLCYGAAVRDHTGLPNRTGAMFPEEATESVCRHLSSLLRQMSSFSVMTFAWNCMFEKDAPRVLRGVTSDCVDPTPPENFASPLPLGGQPDGR